uniref:Uncharacterized protein n=1 Tax=Oryza brachyantha TaxID=4533 RepID=J3LGT6_ORYBR
MEMGRDVEGAGQQQQQRRLAVVHSQVRRIKQEEGEKVKVDETYLQHHQVSEMRLALRDLEARQRSRSPLGRAAARPVISIGGGRLVRRRLTRPHTGKRII